MHPVWQAEGAFFLLAKSIICLILTVQMTEIKWRSFCRYRSSRQMKEWLREWEKQGGVECVEAERETEMVHTEEKTKGEKETNS